MNISLDREPKRRRAVFPHLPKRVDETILSRLGSVTHRYLWFNTGTVQFVPNVQTVQIVGSEVKTLNASFSY